MDRERKRERGREEEREKKNRGRGQDVFHFVGVNAANFARACNPTSDRVVTLPWTPGAGHALTFQLSKLSFVFCKASTTLYVFIFEGEDYFHTKNIAKLLTPRTTSLQRL